jgi:hypothetical protein
MRRKTVPFILKKALLCRCRLGRFGHYKLSKLCPRHARAQISAKLSSGYLCNSGLEKDKCSNAGRKRAAQQW